MKCFSYLVVIATIFGLVFVSCDKDDNKSEFTVSFNSNGGSSVLPQNVKEGEKVIKPEDPIHSGYVLVAWYKDAELTIEWMFDTDVVTADVTLFAKWRFFNPLFNIDELTMYNYPKVNGSTSTSPLITLIACKLLGIDYEWIPTSGHTQGIMPSSDDPKYWYLVNNGGINSFGTHEAFINLIDKKADIILVARQISSDEKSYADAAGVSLIEIPIALDALVFIVNSENPIQSLTTKQLQDIYTGKITDWNEVGGDKEEIKPFVRNANSGSQELMESLVMKDLDAMQFPNSIEKYDPWLLTMVAAIEEVSNYKNAICYTVFYYKEQIITTNTVKSVTVDGVYPDKKSISDNSYPYVAEVYAVIRSDLDKSSMAYKLFELLQTEDGKRVITESGYIAN